MRPVPIGQDRKGKTMLYNSADDWSQSKNKRAALFGMSGLGKTHISNILRASGDWFHYSIDYRIGTRHMGEFIVDNFKYEAMKNPFLADLLLSDSMDVRSNISFENLAPLSTYMGKPGDIAKGGLPFDEYMRRQAQHKIAEISALLETGHFIRRAQTLYGYDNFICDTGGSLCEVVDPSNPDDPVLNALSSEVLPVWIKGADSHTDTLIGRFSSDPKPMYYAPDVMHDLWARYLENNTVAPEKVDPNGFMVWGYSEAIKRRQPLYGEIAEKWGVTVSADEISAVRTCDDFNSLVARALARR
jgi:hypothetical protein